MDAQQLSLCLPFLLIAKLRPRDIATKMSDPAGQYGGQDTSLVIFVLCDLLAMCVCVEHTRAHTHTHNSRAQYAYPVCRHLQRVLQMCCNIEIQRGCALLAAAAASHPSEILTWRA
mmetsp:Transcript_61206/g.121146  ORF Transcript_61206/g.121146 Transcript_61206/m.121146 type:complete len:116 (-) Transcript_61206:1425-1772(-)